ncbi:MAG TPA: hypothetical protein VMS64_35795 [Candidatus Methylomirabilis sp.]|nr:hypothetical protein [Candidatus Methylomirabilis sp.]
MSMACLGRTGQWGNALMAYFFLKAFAAAHHMTPEVPRWIGQDLFGRRDDPMTHAHPVILYDMVSEICRDVYHPMVTASLAVSRARAVGEGGRRLTLLRDPLLDRPDLASPTTSVDLEGPYLLHTRYLARHRDFLRRAVEPVPALREGLEAGWSNLRGRGDIVIGLHVRRGDFDSKFVHQGFEFVTPIGWYRSWLDRLWARYERPVLFVAGDSPAQTLRALDRYHPVTIRDLGVKLPAELRTLDLPPAHLQRDAEFFPDWFMLTRCHALAISNSTFSFTASMANTTASVFARPDLPAKALLPFEPWNSEPLLFLPPSRNLLLEVLSRLSLSQQGMGRRSMVPNLGRALRWYGQVLRSRMIASRHYSGTPGLFRELLRPGFYLAACRRYDERVPGDARPGLPAIPP